MKGRASLSKAGFTAGALALTLGACGPFGTFGPVYPPRPPASPGPLVADPSPSRVVVHVTVTRDGLKGQVDGAVPRTGDGTFPLLGKDRRYAWDRDPFALDFSQGKIALATKVHVEVDLPLKKLDFPLDVKVSAEPIVSSEYKVKLQAVDVSVASSDKRLVVADHVAGVFEQISKELATRIKDFTYELRPTIDEAYKRLGSPIDLPIGEAHGCASVKVLGVEAGPTILADGIEKDMALVVAPEVTLPCSASEQPPLPPFANVAMVPPGPFTVTIPIAARYEELAKAMGVLFTDGKYYFSTEFPKLYLESPQVYESQGRIVLEVRVRGPVHKFGIDAEIDGNIYFGGHIAVTDNAVQIPDLEPTIETKSFFLSLKALAEGDKIRDQARDALRIDLGERLAAVKDKVNDALTFGTPQACFAGNVDKIELTAAHTHGNYLRAYVAVTARANASMPCLTPLPAGPPKLDAPPAP